jgi:uncharacterized protein YbbC (DUF1343 family)
VIPAAALALAVAAAEPPDAPRVRVGLEALEAGEAPALRGRRAGLIGHAASQTAQGRGAADVLRGAGVRLVRLFAPEHGWSGTSAAGAAVGDAVDPDTRLPVVSLYGARSRPEPSQLADLDVLVVDLQDAGVRFYTYESTLILALEAAAEAGIELVVLDRPNPLGGERVEGPEADPEAPRTLVNTAPGPLVHGLTLGEMARYVNLRRARPARLTVVPMQGWRRDMTWPETGRRWVPPSPSLRSADAALAYPGICLLEATNVSEGRGTDEPFLLLGAPWIEPPSLARAVSVPGFAVEPARFTPRATEAALQPKHAGRECRGLRVRVTDAPAIQPYRLGVSLLAALRRLDPSFRWRDDGLALDRLLGTTRLRAALERGESVDAILAEDAGAIERFRRERAAALLYRR